MPSPETSGRSPPLNPDGPLPLHQQVALAFRYKIATGEIEPGERLPPLREVATRWAVNYHTVRKGYGVLEDMGLVETRQGSGTRVVGTPGADRTSFDPVELFVRGVTEEAQARFGLSRSQLAALISEPRPADAQATTNGRRVTVVECNPHQCSDLAAQVRDAFDLEVDEFVLTEPGSPGPGTLIGTYFHLTEMRQRWPERRDEMHCLALHPDPAIRERIAPWCSPDTTLDVPFCERESTLGTAMAEHVQRLLPAGVRVVPVTQRSVEETLAARPGRPVFIAPRLWNDLAPDVRARPEAIEVPYRFGAHTLRDLGRQLGW